MAWLASCAHWDTSCNLLMERSIFHGVGRVDQSCAAPMSQETMAGPLPRPQPSMACRMPDRAPHRPSVFWQTSASKIPAKVPYGEAGQDRKGRHDLVHGASLRLDKWLWFARLAKSRGCAKALCESRRLRIDGRVVERASALVRAGQVLSFPDQGRLEGGVIIVRVESLAERRGPFCEARLMYTDLAVTLPSAPAMHHPDTASAGAMMQQARNQPLTAPSATF